MARIETDIDEQIELKVQFLTYKALRNMAPLYLIQFLSVQKLWPGNYGVIINTCCKFPLHH